MRVVGPEMALESLGTRHLNVSTYQIAPYIYKCVIDPSTPCPKSGKGINFDVLTTVFTTCLGIQLNWLDYRRVAPNRTSLYLIEGGVAQIGSPLFYRYPLSPKIDVSTPLDLVTYGLVVRVNRRRYGPKRTFANPFNWDVWAATATLVPTADLMVKIWTAHRFPHWSTRILQVTLATSIFLLFRSYKAIVVKNRVLIEHVHLPFLDFDDFIEKVGRSEAFLVSHVRGVHRTLRWLNSDTSPQMRRLRSAVHRNPVLVVGDSKSTVHKQIAANGSYAILSSETSYQNARAEFCNLAFVPTGEPPSILVIPFKRSVPGLRNLLNSALYTMKQAFSIHEMQLTFRRRYIHDLDCDNSLADPDGTGRYPISLDETRLTLLTVFLLNLIGGAVLLIIEIKMNGSGNLTLKNFDQISVFQSDLKTATRLLMGLNVKLFG